MTIKLICFTFLLIPFLSYSQTTAQVVGIKDGDTIVVLLENKTQQTLRLAEVDCPESGQAFGKNAKQFTSNAVFGKEITFEETDQDRWGRTIAKIYYDDNLYLSAEIIKAGFGWWYHYYSDDETLGELQKEAEQQKLGLWQDSHAIPPWEFRRLKKSKNIIKYR
ncbi:thermonuclease family protein [Moheibacter sp.]|uniref:thermonuclease family protein n=1 Tax=Moheibacter sp. TaxID=1965316 RepID=UPI003C790F97